MDLQKRLEHIANVKSKIFLDSEDEKVKKLHISGKNTATERMNMLFDAGTFVEVGAFVKKRPTEIDAEIKSGEYEGAVTGYGAVDGRLVFAYSQDFSRQSGTLSESNAKKILALYDMAIKNGAPVVSIFDSAGVSITEGLDALSGYGAIINKASLCSGLIPQFSLIFGTCSGGQAMIASISDFVIMEKKNGKLFLNSPFVIKNNPSADGDVSETLGTAEFNEKTGSCTKSAEKEEVCFDELKKLMSFIPSNNQEDITISDKSTDSVNRLSESVSGIIQTEKYDMKKIIEDIADDGIFYETEAKYVENTICGFANIGNIAVGIVANQPNFENGMICPGSCSKAEKFIKFCDSFNLPIVTLVDTVGTVFAERAETNQFSRHAAKMASAYAISSVPKITLNIGKAYGAAYVLMGSKQLGTDIVLAYPTSEINVLAPDTAVNFLYNDKISKSKDPVSERNKLTEEYTTIKSSPVNAAAGGQIDNIIDPEQTRQFIASSLFLLKSKCDIRI